MTSVGPASACAAMQEGNWTRSNFFLATLCPDDRGIPRLKATPSERRQRPDRHRAQQLSMSSSGDYASKRPYACQMLFGHYVTFRDESISACALLAA